MEKTLTCAFAGGGDEMRRTQRASGDRYKYGVQTEPDKFDGAGFHLNPGKIWACFINPPPFSESKPALNN